MSADAEIEGTFAVRVRIPRGGTVESVAQYVEDAIAEIVLRNDPFVTIHAAVKTVNGHKPIAARCRSLAGER